MTQLLNMGMIPSDFMKNTRKKYWVDSDGELHLYEMMVADHAVFRPSGLELSEFSKEVEWRLDYEAANRELFGDGFESSDGYVSDLPPDHVASALSSRRRARRRIFDYIVCNDFDCFVTLTLDGSLIDRDNYSAVIKKLSTYLDNRVRRNGLIYVGVPELHKNGGLHFHFCMNSSALKLVYSGCVSVEGRKKPIKESTAKRLRIPEPDWHRVYNVTDWKLGFSTAIYTYGDRGAVARYMSKELNKVIQKNVTADGVLEKIGGRWYLSGGKLSRPVVVLDNVNYSSVNGTYSFDCPMGTYKVVNFNEDGSILKYGSSN